jgi:hypothetical protein
MYPLDNQKYVVLSKFLSDSRCSQLTRALFGSLRAGHFDRGDPGVRDCFSKYAHPLTEDLLLESLPQVQHHVGTRLEPTYSFARVYGKGAVLRKHKDRFACEFSVTLNIACASDPWPIWINNGVETVTIVLLPGDAMLYKGCDCPHWREPLRGDWVLQVFLHYINPEGPFAAFRFDQRDSLNLSNSSASAARSLCT